MQNHPGAKEISRYTKANPPHALVQDQILVNLVSDVPGQQYPHGSAPCWTLYFQFVLGIVGEAVNVLHRPLLPIPAAADQTPSQSQPLPSKVCIQPTQQSSAGASEHTCECRTTL